MSARAVRSSVVAIATAIGLFATTPAFAQSTPGLFPERHFACRERPTAHPPVVAKDTAAALAALRRRPPPSALPIAPLVVIDSAVAEPLPSRVTESPPPPEPPVAASAPQDWRCIGFARGKAGILRVLRAPPMSRFADQADARSWLLLNARAASTAAFSEALPALRRMLARPTPDDPDAAEHPEGSRFFDALDIELNAARALGDLRDATSAPTFRDRLRRREDRSYSGIWLAGWAALAHLDRAAAQAQAAEVVDRIAAGRKPTDPNAASDDALLREVLPHITTPDPAHLAAVRRLPGADTRCDALAARVRLGDATLRDELRAELAADLATRRGVACYGELMPDLFPGRSPDEVKTLLFRHRMEAILDLLRRGRDAPAEDPAWQRARTELRAVLAARANDPDVAGGKNDSRYQPRKRARLLVALAELGDAGARADAERLIRDPNDHGVAPWIAAAEALRFGWAAAPDLAAARLGLAIRDHTDRYDTDPDPVRGFARLNDHTVVVDALAARRDPRFALGLLDRDRSVREVAALHLARLQLPATCEVVTSAAASADESAVQDAFWALSMLGDACREHAHRHATDPRAPAAVRGMALELLAMMRDPRARPLLAPRGRGDDIRPARERARIIFEAKE